MKFRTNYDVNPKINEHIRCPRIKGSQFFYIFQNNFIFAITTDRFKMKHYEIKERHAT